MRQDRERSLATFGALVLGGLVMAVAPFGAFAQKPPKSYPEEGKVIGRGTTEHTAGVSTFYTQTYKVETDKAIFVLDCCKKPFFGKRGAECGGDKKIQLGEAIRFRVEKNYDLSAEEATVLFTEDFLTQRDVKRIVLECPVRSLHSVLNHLSGRGTKIEHIYDY